MKPQVYKDPRPEEYFTRFHEQARRQRPDPIYEVVRLLLTPILMLFYRTRCIDSDKVPMEGPAVITPNHFSFFDHFFIAVYLRRKVHFMAKSQLFKRPMQFIYRHGGVFPVLRGRRDEEAFKTARTILDRGDLVVMYAEGGRSRSGTTNRLRRHAFRFYHDDQTAEAHRRSRLSRVRFRWARNLSWCDLRIR